MSDPKWKSGVPDDRFCAYVLRSIRPGSPVCGVTFWDPKAGGWLVCAGVGVGRWQRITSDPVERLCSVWEHSVLCVIGFDDERVGGISGELIRLGYPGLDLSLFRSPRPAGISDMIVPIDTKDERMAPTLPDPQATPAAATPEDPTPTLLDLQATLAAAIRGYKSACDVALVAADAEAYAIDDACVAERKAKKAKKALQRARKAFEGALSGECAPSGPVPCSMFGPLVGELPGWTFSAEGDVVKVASEEASWTMTVDEVRSMSPEKARMMAGLVLFAVSAGSVGDLTSNLKAAADLAGEM